MLRVRNRTFLSNFFVRILDWAPSSRAWITGLDTSRAWAASVPVVGETKEARRKWRLAKP